jgi:hypothetical protein
MEQIIDPSFFSYQKHFISTLMSAECIISVRDNNDAVNNVEQELGNVHKRLVANFENSITFQLFNQSINKVEIIGIVTNIEITAKKLIIVCDDSTSSIRCIKFHDERISSSSISIGEEERNILITFHQILNFTEIFYFFLIAAY